MTPASTGMVRGQTYVQLRPDRVILQDVLGQTAMLQFMQTRRATTAVPTSVHCDHLIQARVEGGRDLNESLAENDEVYNFLRAASAKYGVGFWSPGAGIIHQVAFENYAYPGEMIDWHGLPHTHGRAASAPSPWAWAGPMRWKSWQDCLGRCCIPASSACVSPAR